MCDSTDPDLGDQLRFKADFHGTGDLARVHCRNTIDYPELRWYNNVTLCVSDRQPFPGHEICQTYSVKVRPARSTCKVVNAGSSTNNNTTNLYFTEFFRIGEDRSLVTRMAANGATPYFDGVTSAYCLSGGFPPFYSYATLYGNGAMSNDRKARGDYGACYAYAYDYDTGAPPPRRRVSWEVKVCDPGTF
jgi:hypothetical protein